MAPADKGQAGKASTSATSSSTTTAGAKSTTTTTKKELPHLPPLEADDEFEDFPAEDWEESETYGAALARSNSSNAGAAAAAGADAGADAAKAQRAKGLDSLWEDSWDDDDIADDFSVQLRGELQRQNQMQT